MNLGMMSFRVGKYAFSRWKAYLSELKRYAFQIVLISYCFSLLIIWSCRNQFAHHRNFY